MGPVKGSIGNPTIFLDRDGVITREILRVDGTFGSPRETFEIEFIDQSVRTLKNYSGLGFNTVVISNQPDIQNNKVQRSTLDQINKQLFEYGHLSAILYCPHNRNKNCQCRKPKTKMLTWAASYFGVSPIQCVMIGDRITDINAAEKFGCEAIHISDLASSCLDFNHQHFTNLEQSSSYIFRKFNIEIS